ncbi:MAG: DUF3267 domain-containing protein [Chloroflexi bacterium]|nr:DUF3267 domain-containing protein [Chloroflexota bacterium]
MALLISEKSIHQANHTETCIRSTPTREHNMPTIPVSGSLPNDYQEVLYWRVTDKPTHVIAIQILALISLVIFGLIFFVLAVSLGKMPTQIAFGMGEIGAVLLGVLLAMGLHELTHGLTMQMFGAEPKYGILWKGLMLYATSPGYAYPRNNYIVIALAPFVVISTFVISGMWLLQGTLWVPLFALCGIFNASGAIGDMWMTMIVLRYPATAYVMDERDGLRLFLPITLVQATG